MGLGFFFTVFSEKYSNIILHENPSSGSRSVSMQTEGLMNMMNSPNNAIHTSQRTDCGSVMNTCRLNLLSRIIVFIALIIRNEYIHTYTHTHTHTHTV